jgi:hypothetical protein
MFEKNLIIEVPQTCLREQAATAIFVSHFCCRYALKFGKPPG